MEIYIEYAILENFCVDVALLYLALAATKQTVACVRLCLAGAIGAVFAVVFPLLQLPTFVLYALKFLVGALLCIVAVKKQNGRGRYALTVCAFYGFSFAFAGGLFAVFEIFSVDYAMSAGGGVVTNVPVGGLLFAAVAFAALAKKAIARFYQKRAIHNDVFACELSRGAQTKRTNGFLDTGNALDVDGKPVCFVTPDLIYDLFGLDGASKRVTFQTMAGNRETPVYALDAFQVFDGKKRIFSGGVYLAPSAGLVGREYKILLHRSMKE